MKAVKEAHQISASFFR